MISDCYTQKAPFCLTRHSYKHTRIINNKHTLFEPWNEQTDIYIKKHKHETHALVTSLETIKESTAVLEVHLINEMR